MPYAAYGVTRGTVQNIIRPIEFLRTVNRWLHEFLEDFMEIGKPQREIYIEPIELPHPLREKPEHQPQERPEHEPQEIPA